MPNGLWLQIVLSNETSFEHKNIPSIAEGIYLAKRRYMSTPGLEKIHFFSGTKNIGSYDPKGDNNVGMFATFAAENPSANGYPFAKSEDKETLVAFGIPFEIKAANEVESKFEDKDGNQQFTIHYDIELDTTHDNFTVAQRLKQIEPGYRLSLPSNLFRRNQMNKLINPAIERGETVRCKLIKKGKGYDFQDVD